MDMSVQRRGTVLQRLLSREGFDATAAYFIMDWAAVARDIFGGLLIAGAVAAWVPDSCLDGRELRRAGVGSATLYRNLANRRQLSDLRFSLDRNALARFRRRVCEAAPTGLPTRHTPLVHCAEAESAPAARADGPLATMVITPLTLSATSKSIGAAVAIVDGPAHAVSRSRRRARGRRTARRYLAQTNPLRGNIRAVTPPSPLAFRRAVAQSSLRRRSTLV
jgi:hypothetical protein